MGDSRILKLGAFAVATVATAAGSLLLADKSLKVLIKGVVGSGPTTPTKLRKPVKDGIVPNFGQDFVAREQSTQQPEDILPMINLDDVASIVNNAVNSNDFTLNELTSIEKSPIESNEIDITPMEPTPTPIDIMPIEATPIEVTSIEPTMMDINEFEAQAIMQPPISNDLPIIDTNPMEEEPKPEMEMTFGLPYIAGKLENLDCNEDAQVNDTINMERPIKQEPEIITSPIAEIEPEKIQETTTEKQEESSNPFLDMSLIQQDTLNLDNSVTATSTVIDEPIAATPSDEERMVLERTPVIVSGRHLDNAEDQLPPEPVLSQIEPQIGITKEDINLSIEPEEPVVLKAAESGKTKVIGTNIVSDEPYNKAIDMVVLQFKGVERDRLVSIMSQDGAGLVFEFSNNRVKNENTLDNVFSITKNGKVVLPPEHEKAGALAFGKTFITDKPELSEFFTR